MPTIHCSVIFEHATTNKKFVVAYFCIRSQLDDYRRFNFLNFQAQFGAAVTFRYGVTDVLSSEFHQEKSDRYSI